MKELTMQQIKIVANKIHEYAEMIIYTHDPEKIGRIIAKIGMLSDMIADGYNSYYSEFEREFNAIIEI